MEQGIDAQQLSAIGDFAIGWAQRIVSATITLTIGWILSRWLARMVRSLALRSARVDEAIGAVLARVVRLAVLVTVLLAVLDRFGVQTTSVVALLGAAGLAIGLALQGSLSNVAAGVMILGLRPFKLGDAVDIAGTSGVVEDIGLFVTQLKTFDGLAVFLPNSRVWGTEITNFARNDHRRLDLSFGIGYSDDTAKALQILQELVEVDDRIFDEPAPLVALESLGDSSVNLLVRSWVHRSDLFGVKLDLTRNTKERFDAEGISFPFPRRTVHLIRQESNSLEAVS
jgi:small conductance mechanosensitive channel